jgi:hypothetical protein
MRLDFRADRGSGISLPAAIAGGSESIVVYNVYNVYNARRMRMPQKSGFFATDRAVHIGRRGTLFSRGAAV